MTTLRMEGQGEESKSSDSKLPGDVARKLSILFTESDDESDLTNGGLVEEEKLEEIMQELYREITMTSSSSYNTSPPPTKVTSPSLSSSCRPFISINDVTNSESCGASMSDLSSTVMAGIEFMAPNWKYLNVGLPEMGSRSPENELWVIGMGFNDNINTNK